MGRNLKQRKNLLKFCWKDRPRILNGKKKKKTHPCLHQKCNYFVKKKKCKVAVFFRLWKCTWKSMLLSQDSYGNKMSFWGCICLTLARDFLLLLPFWYCRHMKQRENPADFLATYCWNGGKYPGWLS